MSEHYLQKELYDLIQTDRTIFDFIQTGSLDGLWYWDLENPEREWMNARFWETLGFDPCQKKHLASEWQDLIFQEDLKVAIDNFNKHLEDPNHPYDQVVRYKHKDGSTVWIRCRGIAIRNQEGKPLRMLGAHTDITELKQAEEKLRKLSTHYELVFNGTQDALFLLQVCEDGEFRLLRNNQSHERQTGLTTEDIQHKTPKDLLGEELGESVCGHYRECVKRQDVFTYEEVLTFQGVSKIWNTTLTPIIEKGVVQYIVGSAQDITHQKSLENELQKNAIYDLLTGLPNRRLLFERLEQMIREQKRDSGHFAILFLDLDGFKDVNDTYGHEVGDHVLQEVAKRMVFAVRESDVVARIAGDEFVVLLRNPAKEADVSLVAEHVRNEIIKPIYFEGITCKVDCSIGGAIYPQQGTTADMLLHHADQSMYLVKKSGKAGFSLYHN